MSANPRIAIVETIYDVEESEQPFGKRWMQETVILSAEHIAALHQGKFLALDVQGEYVMYVKSDEAIASERGE